MNLADKYRLHFEDFDVFSEQSYSKSFDYKSENTAFKDLNFVYLVSRVTFSHFKRAASIPDHDFMDDMPDVEMGSFTNDDLLELQAGKTVTHNENYRTLNYTLRDEIAEQDMVFLGEKMFRVVKSMFTNLKEIKRPVYRVQHELKVELYLPQVKVLLLNNEELTAIKLLAIHEHVVTLPVSKFMNGQDLKELFREVAQNSGKSVRDGQVLLPESDELGLTEARNLTAGRATLVDTKDDNLSRFDIYDGRLIVYYFKQAFSEYRLKFNIERKAAIVMERASDSYKPSGLWRYRSDSEDLMDADNAGVVGLSNVGNTCYMASALQCILHNEALKSFMTMDNLADQINNNNPLGTKGEILNALSELFRLYWRTRANRLSPSKFKYVVGKHLITFEGFAQHDSQEFLSQILDAIHEDVNRILNKPYTETIEGKPGDSDLVVARKSWINFLKRNYSFLIENFYGQFKSTVRCPTCQNTSVTFDPYQIVSLSIPTIARQEFTFFSTNADQTEKAVKYGFSARSMHNFNDIQLSTVIEAYSKKVNVPAERLQFALLGFSKIGEVCSPHATLSVFYDLLQSYTTKPKVFLMELNDVDLACKGDPQALELYLRTNYEVYDREDLSRNSYEYMQLQREFSEDPIFTKVLYLTRRSSVRDLFVAVLRKLYHCTSLAEQGPRDQAFFENLWSLLENKMKEKIFFYLKIGGAKLGINALDRKLGEFAAEDVNKLVVNVFIRMPKSTTVKIDLSKLLSCVQDRDEDLSFDSDDLGNYKGEYSLEYLLNAFSQPEVLGKDNAWYCSGCKDHVQAVKTIQIYKAPRFLVIHLKKLKFQGKKLPLIRFPVHKLDVDPFVLNKEPTQAYNVAPEEFLGESDQDFYAKHNVDVIIRDHNPSSSLSYKLYGVVNHFGGQHFGHYTSFAETPSGQWFEFNDASTSLLPEEKIESDGAYLLFYKKIDN